MKTIKDWSGALAAGLDAIRGQYKLPGAFPAEVEAAAEAAARRPLDAHADRTSVPFVTLDPVSSTDLDQAFAIERSGGDLILHYAIADVGWFVSPDDPIDREAWARGVTIYLPDDKVRLYPAALSEGAASLLPDGERPAVIFTVRVAGDGQASLQAVERARIRSRAKLGYATVTAADLPDGFDELARRVAAAELHRGAWRTDPPQQELRRSERGFVLGFRPMSPVERCNAALSLAANLAIAQSLLAHGAGLFRTMAEPGKKAIKRLRHSATAFGLEWPANIGLEQFERGLDPADPKHAAFMLAIRRAGQDAGYAPFQPGVVPWHSAVAATYVHATAPLRRLADRYVNEAALAVANGRSVPEPIEAAFAPLAETMDRADARAAQIDSAVIELAEAVVLSGRVGDRFEGRVTDIDQRGARVQLCSDPVVTRIPGDGLALGEAVTLTLTEADPVRRLTRFARA
ncbi:RNB domain-containing ribonuclease [Sphingomonas mesophila]|uniref:RNB domain-containing ribonuclease n=1 Tax=Sphingomonas mesophila TaxID=2303576 RepID=UPI000E56B368|nr:RNB domain-containing ribonuclease [Sphingomonas mesophila]